MKRRKYRRHKPLTEAQKRVIRRERRLLGQDFDGVDLHFPHHRGVTEAGLENQPVWHHRSLDCVNEPPIGGY